MAVEIKAGTEERQRRTRCVQGQAGEAPHLLKAFTADGPQVSGKEYKISGSFPVGLTQENAKIAKIIATRGPKA